jgi:hypothetical protein
MDSCLLLEPSVGRDLFCNYKAKAVRLPSILPPRSMGWEYLTVGIRTFLLPTLVAPGHDPRSAPVRDP